MPTIAARPSIARIDMTRNTTMQTSMAIRGSLRTLAALIAIFIAISMAISFPAHLDARTRPLIASDGQTYSDTVGLSAVTRQGDRYETATGRLLMEGSLAAPAKLFSDIQGLPGWISNLAVAEETKARALTDRSVYMRFSAPLGFEDRDGLMRFVAFRDGPQVIVLAFEDIPGFPLRPDAVRMTRVRGRFRVEQVSPGHLAVEFRLHYDSKARPVALANLSVRQQVEQTLLRMRRRVEGPLRGARMDEEMAQSLGLK